MACLCGKGCLAGYCGWAPSAYAVSPYGAVVVAKPAKEEAASALELAAAASEYELELALEVVS